MNRCSQNLSVLRAIDGFIKYKLAEGLSQRSVESYEYVLRRWVEHKGDRPLDTIHSNDITGYLAWLRTEYVPVRKNNKTYPLSNKTLRNIWITFMAFFKWVNIEFNIPNPTIGIPAPKVQKAPVEPFTKEEIETLLKSCIYSREAKTKMRHSFVMHKINANRDQAIILTLLDTGLRASELCALTIGDVDLKTGKVLVKHGSSGKAKGGKGRIVYIGKVARRALWRYLTKREDGEDYLAPLFINYYDRPLNKDSLRILLSRMGKRVGIQHTYPHKFRHTFAITYLRSGGDIFTLQALLGHSSLDMVRHYAQIAEVDIEQAHRKASPADNWRL